MRRHKSLAERLLHPQQHAWWKRLAQSRSGGEGGKKVTKGKMNASSWSSRRPYGFDLDGARRKERTHAAERERTRRS